MYSLNQAFEKTSDIDWKSCSNQIPSCDSYVAYFEYNARVAEATIDAVRNLDTGSREELERLTALQAAANEPSVPPKKVAVTVQTEAPDGRKIDNLIVKYWSDGAQRLKCDRKHGVPFATPSYAARQVLGRSRWYVWVEDDAQNVASDPVPIDLTRISNNSYYMKILVDR